MIRQTSGDSMIMRKHQPPIMLQNSLEEEVERLRSSVDNLQHQLRVGVQIESHLQKRIRDLQKENIVLEEKVKRELPALLDYHSQCRTSIISILDEGYSFMKSTIDLIEEKIREFDIGKIQVLSSTQLEDTDIPQNECRDVHISPDLVSEKKEPSLSTRFTSETGGPSEALAQALQEKIEALLLLSQQEERHLLERNVRATLEKKMEELQRNLLQVTNEKVEVLVELAQLKQECQTLKEKMSQGMKEGSSFVESKEKTVVQEREGRLRNLLKGSYLKRWVNPLGSDGGDAESHLNTARMKIEIATLKESLESMEHLTSSVGRLRHSLLKVKESTATQDNKTSLLGALGRIIVEAKLLRTALGSSVPVSWSAEADGRVSTSHDEEIIDESSERDPEKGDFVSAAGFEMVELLILAGQVLTENISNQVRGLMPASGT